MSNDRILKAVPSECFSALRQSQGYNTGMIMVLVLVRWCYRMRHSANHSTTQQARCTDTLPSIRMQRRNATAEGNVQTAL